MLKIKIGDILIVKPNKSLVIVVNIEKKPKSYRLNTVTWLKNYWKTKYNLKLPGLFTIISVNFPSHDKVYEYPRYRKCIKRPFRQKKYRKLFKLQQPKITPFLKRLKGDYNEYLKGEHDRRMFEEDDSDGIMEHEVFDL